MTVTVHLTAQLRAAAGVRSTRVTLNAPATVLDVVQAVVELHAPLRPLIFRNSGVVCSGVLAVCGNEQIDWSAPLDSSELTLISAISGG